MSVPPNESPLGPSKRRVKTDVRLPVNLVRAVEELCEAMFIGKNVFYVFSASILCIKMAPLLRAKKRDKLLKEIETIFQTTMDAVRNS